MKFLKLTSTLVVLYFILFPAYAETALNLEGRYNTALIKRDTHMKTDEFKMTGIEGLLLFQFLPSAMAVRPYIGLGIGLLPSYAGDETTYIGLPVMIDTQITLRGITYATIEIGPEFVFNISRWQIFLSYDHEITGKLSRTDIPEAFTGAYSDTKIKAFRRIRVGTRLYFIVAPNFDMGFIGDYAPGIFKDNGKNNINDIVTEYKFTQITLGFALRVRFGGGSSNYPNGVTPIDSTSNLNWLNGG